jgi:hypothetical protein
MADLKNFVFSLEKYIAIEARHRKIFKVGNSLPDQIFAKGFGNFRFVDFDDMLTKDFWLLLSTCADWAGDIEITMLVHKPDPVEYYFKHFQRYAMLKFEHPSSPEDYYNSLIAEPQDNPADSLLYGSTTVTSWCGTSGNWGFWGDRVLGIGIAAMRDDKLPWPIVVKETIEEYVELFDIDDALDLMSLCFKKQIIPEEIVLPFRRNYSDLSEP